MNLVMCKSRKLLKKTKKLKNNKAPLDIEVKLLKLVYDLHKFKNNFLRFMKKMQNQTESILYQMETKKYTVQYGNKNLSSRLSHVHRYLNWFHYGEGTNEYFINQFYASQLQMVQFGFHSGNDRIYVIKNTRKLHASPTEN